MKYHYAASCSPRFLTLLALAFALSAPRSEAGVVQFEDGLFMPTEWLDVAVVVDSDGGSDVLDSTGAAYQRTFGGNPTFYRLSHHVLNGVDGQEVFYTGGIYLAGYYEPKLQGPINSVSFRINGNSDPLLENNQIDSGWRPILLQDDRLYYSKQSTTLDKDVKIWTLEQLSNLDAANFDSSPLPTTAPNSEQPDFSLDGQPIYFGYSINNLVNAGFQFDEYRGVDNWHVDVNSASSSLIGDFNGDNLINAADYVVWRNAFESNTPTGGPYEGADANGNGMADANDYDRWAMNYGRTAVVPSGSSFTAVPEPAAALQAIGSLIVVAAGRRRSRRGQ